MFDSWMMRSMNESMALRSTMRGTEDCAHGGRDGFPLPTLGLGLPPALGCEGVILSRAARLAVSPGGLEESRALHLVERGIYRAFLHEELLSTATFGFLNDLVAVHRALAQQCENQHTNGAGEKFAVVVHRAL